MDGQLTYVDFPPAFLRVVLGEQSFPPPVQESTKLNLERLLITSQILRQIWEALFSPQLWIAGNKEKGKKKKTMKQKNRAWEIQKKKIELMLVTLYT